MSNTIQPQFHRVKKKVEAFIIGGGLAGMSVALRMAELGHQFILIDPKRDQPTSSRLASGIINPITGRRFAKTWLYESLETSFLEFYKKWEHEWETKLLKPIEIYRAITDHRLVNDLDAKLSDAAYTQHCRPLSPKEIQSLQSSVNFPDKGYVFYGYQLDCINYLNHAIQFLESKHQYFEDHFIFSKDDVKKDTFHYKEFETQRLIFAQGAATLQNPPFDWIGLTPNKGEILKIPTEKFNIVPIIKKRLYVIPQDKEYWVGSFSTWKTDHENPTQQGLQYLNHHLSDIIDIDPVTTGHYAAFRPTSIDRRPIIGLHPENPALVIFNGFGSKGCSLIPYFSHQFCQALWDNGTLDPLVNVHRFWAS